MHKATLFTILAIIFNLAYVLINPSHLLISERFSAFAGGESYSVVTELDPTVENASPDWTITPVELGYHYIVIDDDGNILPWYNPDNLGASYDHILHLVFEWWLNIEHVPGEPDIPYYLMHRIWPGEGGIGGDQLAMAMSSWRLFYDYTGDSRMIEDMILMADHVLLNGLSAPTDEWPNIPYPYNVTTLDHYDGNLIYGVGYTEPDKAGSFGYELLNLYKITEDIDYLQAAINIADTLAGKTQAGDIDDSPLPYRVNAIDGTVGDAYTTNYSGLLMLWEGLIDLGQGNITQYQTAHGRIINWLKDYPLQNNEWGPFFEDVAIWSDTQINAVTLAMYIMEHRETWGSTWQQDARSALDWAIDELANNNWLEYGVQVINEQTVYRVPGNSHTSRQASMELRYAELTGDTTHVQNAIRQLSWANYMVDTDGKNRYPNDDIWLTDGYGDYVRHYLRSMAAAPYLAPDFQNHLLRTTSVIQEIDYQENIIVYRTFDDHSQELLRINSFQPISVLADGVALPHLDDISDLDQMEGYTFGAPGDLPSVLRIRHDSAQQIVISGFPDEIIPVTGVSLTGISMGETDTLYPFTATIDPLTATQPITYVWQATGHAPITITDGAVATTDFSWSTPGNKTITVMASNIAGSAQDTFNVMIEEPVSGLIASNDSPTVLGEQTSLHAEVAAGSDVTYAWDFGDGTSGSGADVTHVYTSTGEFTAAVTASNDVSSETAKTTVTITDVPIGGLSAENDGPTPQGEATNLHASITEGSNVSYTWDFGDGTAGNGANESHVYPAVGTYTATVTASNSVSSDTATTSVTIFEAPIEGLTATNDSPTQPGDTTHLQATITGGSNVSYTWDFGDGTPGSGANTSHIYPAEGVYTATVTASNSVSSDTAKTSVLISELAIAGLSATNDSPTHLGSVTHFQATITDGSDVSFAWDFGDGASDSGAETSHIYDAVGVFTATVTASNSIGSVVATTLVEITDIPITGLSATNDSPTLLGQATTFQAGVTAGSNVIYIWDFGDQTSAVGQAVTHIYHASGLYIATLTATNSAGLVAAQTYVNVFDSIYRIYMPTNLKGDIGVQ